MSTDMGSIRAVLTLDRSDYVAGLKAAGVEADELGKHDPKIHIEVNATEAVSQLKAVQAASDSASDRMTKNNERTSRSGSALLTTIVALGPAIVPLTGAALGLGSALVGMGAAGVLAIGGIKKEMAAGTTLGKAYTAQVHTLQGDLAILQRTAANGVLAPFKAVVVDLNARMPALNTEIGRFSSALGATAVPAVHALFEGWTALQPLLSKSSVVMVQIAQGADRFAQSRGFHDFIAYAAAELPSVMTLLGSLLTTVGHIVVAFEPVGSTVVTVLTLVSSAIDAIPLPILATMATLGVGVYVAFKTWSGISSIVDSVSGSWKKAVVNAEALAIGSTALGIATAGAGIALAIAAYAWNKHQEAVQAAKRAVDDYTQALVASNGVVDANIRKMAAKALIDSGAAKTAADLNTSLQDLVTAALDPTSEAYKRLSAAQAAQDSTIKSGISTLAHQNTVFGQQATLVNTTTVAHQGLTDSLNGQNATLTAAKKAWQEQQDINAAAVIITDSNAEAQRGLAARIGTTVDALSRAQLAQQSQTNSAQAATLQMQLENDAAGILKGSLDALNGKALSAADAQNAFDSSLANMGDHVTATGKKVKFTTTSINDMSAASVSLRGQLNGQIHNLEGVIEANGGLANSTAGAKAQYKDLRQKIIDNAVAHGVDRAAVTKYVDALLKVPKSVPPTKLDIDAAAAKAAIAEITKARTVWLTLKVANTQGANVHAALADLHQAYGGIQHFAAGGIHGSLPAMATIARDGANLVNWAEKGTGDEAFIPLSPARRQSSLPVLEEANRRMGNPLGSGGIDYTLLAAAIASAMGRVNLYPTISAGSVDRAVGATL